MREHQEEKKEGISTLALKPDISHSRFVNRAIDDRILSYFLCVYIKKKKLFLFSLYFITEISIMKPKKMFHAVK